MNSPPLLALPSQPIPPIRPTLAETSRGTGSSGGSSISNHSSYTSTTSSSYSSSTHSYSSGQSGSGYINGENPYSKLVIMDSSTRKDTNFPFPFVSSIGSSSLDLNLPSLSTTPSTTSSSSRSSSYTTSPTTSSNSSTKSLPNSRSNSFAKDSSEHLQTLKSLREEESTSSESMAEADFNSRSLVGMDEEPEESPFFPSVSTSTSTSTFTSPSTTTNSGKGTSPRRSSLPSLPRTSISESYHSSLPPISVITSNISPPSPSTTPQAFSSTRELPSAPPSLPSSSPPSQAPPLLASTSRPNSNSSTTASAASTKSGSSSLFTSNSNSSSLGLSSNGRPWVRDLSRNNNNNNNSNNNNNIVNYNINNNNNSNYSTDASSLYSSGSGSGWSNKELGIGLISLSENFKEVSDAGLGSGEYKTSIEREEKEIEGTDEVFGVVGGGGIEFLDPRPSPPGAQLQVLRPENDRDPICIKVVLPGFSLDNIQVAMRRGHRVHIVADSWGEGGGHFEKLVSLGADASSAAPRAEFDGVNLLVWVQRRYFPTPTPPTKFSNAIPPYSPNPSITSNDSSASSFTPSLSSDFNSSISRTNGSESEQIYEFEEPITTRSTENPNSKKNSKTLIGREGAKIAAKLAKELSCQRAKEAAKSLPKLPSSAAARRFAPGCDYTSNSLGSVRNFVSGMGLGRSNSSNTSKSNKEGSNSGDNEVGSNRSTSGGSPPTTSSSSGRPGMPRRTSSYGKGQTTHGEVTKDIDTSNVSLSSSPSNSSTSSATPRAGTIPIPGSSFPSSSSYTSTSNSNSSNKNSIGNSIDNNSSSSNTSSRPKLRGSNLTLRPSGTTSFFEAAMGALTHAHLHSNTSSHTSRSRSNSITKSEVGEAELKTPRDERGEFKFTSLNSSSKERKGEEEVVGRAQ